MRGKRMILLIGLLSSCLGIAVQSEASEFNFAVNPKPSHYQIDPQNSYFDLLLGPDQKVSLTVELRNDTDKEIVVEAQINRATTNGNGVVEYSENDSKSDQTLKYDLQDYAEAPAEIVLKPHMITEYQVNLHMPAEKFSGVIAGGIAFSEKNTEKRESFEDRGLAIKNEFSYVIALLMRQTTENGTPDLKLLRAQPNQRNARNVIQGKLQNPAPVYLNQLATKTTITEKGQSKPTYTEERTGMQMAPNSNFDLSVPLKGERLKAGKYTIHVEAYGQEDPTGAYQFKGSQKFRYHWSLEQDFTIKAEKARKLNASDVTIKPDYTELYLLVGAVLLISNILLLFILWRKKKRRG